MAEVAVEVPIVSKLVMKRSMAACKNLKLDNNKKKFYTLHMYLSIYLSICVCVCVYVYHLYNQFVDTIIHVTHSVLTPTSFSYDKHG